MRLIKKNSSDTTGTEALLATKSEEAFFAL
jgi:hypothetical protein